MVKMDNPTSPDLSFSVGSLSSEFSHLSFQPSPRPSLDAPIAAGHLAGPAPVEAGSRNFTVSKPPSVRSAASEFIVLESATSTPRNESGEEDEIEFVLNKSGLGPTDAITELPTHSLGFPASPQSPPSTFLQHGDSSDGETSQIETGTTVTQPISSPRNLQSLSMILSLSSSAGYETSATDTTNTTSSFVHIPSPQPAPVKRSTTQKRKETRQRAKARAVQDKANALESDTPVPAEAFTTPVPDAAEHQAALSRNTRNREARARRRERRRRLNNGGIKGSESEKNSEFGSDVTDDDGEGEWYKQDRREEEEVENQVLGDEDDENYDESFSTFSKDIASDSIDSFLSDAHTFMAGGLSSKLQLWQALCLELGVCDLPSGSSLLGTSLASRRSSVDSILTSTQHASIKGDGHEYDEDDRRSPTPTQLHSFPTSLASARKLLKEHAFVNLRDYLELREDLRRGRYGEDGVKGAIEGDKGRFEELRFKSRNEVIRYTFKNRRFVKLKAAKASWLEPLLFKIHESGAQ